MSEAGDLIRRARERSRISQRELARRAGTSQASISRIERGLEEPTLARIEQILAGLGWRPVIELEPIAAHDAEPRRLYEQAGADPAARLEGGLNWIDFGRELLGAARDGGD
ncbi:MAG TPA: helix-turn-helix transcriptional regulator [Solirubrobacterales bacterium]|nr:helix-turn-helix transcriptional regulator [Solirubrobacterales bacterium]